MRPVTIWDAPSSQSTHDMTASWPGGFGSMRHARTEPCRSRVRVDPSPTRRLMPNGHRSRPLWLGRPLHTRGFAAVVMSVALAACDAFGPMACTSELRIAFQPQGEQRLVVGASFTASVALSSCGGREHLRDTVTWSARDTLVVRVDSATGRVTARAPGSTTVEARGARYGPLGGMLVRVE